MNQLQRRITIATVFNGVVSIDEQIILRLSFDLQGMTTESTLLNRFWIFLLA